MAFQQGLSGLNAASKGLDVVGNNIANSGTVGFKAASAHFADVYATAMSIGSSSQVGIGVSTPAIFQQFTQGNIETTNNPLDIAINGDGFFRVQRGAIMGFTRNGQFHTDKDGFIINDNGYQLMGYPATSNGIIVPTNPVSLQIDMSNIAPRPTGDPLGGPMIGNLNLDSREKVPAFSPFNAKNPLTYTYSTTSTVYDSLGDDHNMTFFFVRAPVDGLWDMYASLDGGAATAMNTGTYTLNNPADPTLGYTVTGNPLQFTTSGQLGGATVPPVTTIPAAPTQPLALPRNFVVTTGAASPLGTDPANPPAFFADWTIDLTGTTSYGGPTTVNKLTQGGFAQGQLSGLSVGSTGILLGNYSNGQSKNLGQVVLVDFADPHGLLNLGNNIFQETAASGGALDGVPGAGRRGLLKSASVEASNVDLTVELVNMITLQRAYQANAQTIKTQDQVMQTLVNLR